MANKSIDSRVNKTLRVDFFERGYKMNGTMLYDKRKGRGPALVGISTENDVDYSRGYRRFSKIGPAMPVS